LSLIFHLPLYFKAFYIPGILLIPKKVHNVLGGMSYSYRLTRIKIIIEAKKLTTAFYNRKERDVVQKKLRIVLVKTRENGADE